MLNIDVKANINQQIKALHSLTTKELYNKWQELYGTKAPSCYRKYLIKSLAYRLQELEFGGLSEETGRKLEEIIEQEKRCKKVERVTDLIPGTKIVSLYKNEQYIVTFLGDKVFHMKVKIIKAYLQ